MMIMKQLLQLLDPDERVDEEAPQLDHPQPPPQPPPPHFRQAINIDLIIE